MNNFSILSKFRPISKSSSFSGEKAFEISPLCAFGSAFQHGSKSQQEYDEQHPQEISHQPHPHVVARIRQVTRNGAPPGFSLSINRAIPAPSCACIHVRNSTAEPFLGKETVQWSNLMTITPAVW